MKIVRQDSGVGQQCVPVFRVSLQHGGNQVPQVGAVGWRDGRVLPSQDLHDQRGQALHKKQRGGVLCYVFYVPSSREKKEGKKELLQVGAVGRRDPRLLSPYD
jgi:hypothetical protein